MARLFSQSLLLGSPVPQQVLVPLCYLAQPVGEYVSAMDVVALNVSMDELLSPSSLRCH